MELRDWASLVGAVTGPFGLGLALLVYFRDRAKVDVSVSWDMRVTGGRADDTRQVALLTVRNIGRRPVYVSHAHFVAPGSDGVETPAAILTESIRGVVLPEGAPPQHYEIDQSNMKADAHHWWKVRGGITEASGKSHYTDWLVVAPEWADGFPAPKMAIWWNRIKNRARRYLPC